MVARNLLQYDAALDAEIERLKALQRGAGPNADGFAITSKLRCEHMGITKIEMPLVFTLGAQEPGWRGCYEPKLIPKSIGARARTTSGD